MQSRIRGPAGEVELEAARIRRGSVDWVWAGRRTDDHSFYVLLGPGTYQLIAKPHETWSKLLRRHICVYVNMCVCIYVHIRAVLWGPYYRTTRLY